MENLMNETTRNEVTTAQPQKKGKLKTFFGQFATLEFWRDLLALIIKEAIASFITVLGGTLIYSVQKRIVGDSAGIKKIIDGHQPLGTQTSQPSSVFSSGYQPQTSYKPSYSQNQGVTPSYPGF